MMIASDLSSAKSPLRIAMLSLHSSPLGPLGTRDTGGMSVYVRELSRALGTMGHRVDIFTVARGERLERFLFPNVRLIHLPWDHATLFSKARLPEHLSQVFEAMENYRSTRGLLYDLIHSHYWISGAVGTMAQAQWKRPHLTMFHTLGAVKNRCPGETESDLRIAHEHWLTAAADGIVVPSEREMENMLAFYHAPHDKIQVIACGVNSDLFHPMERRQARRHLGLAPDTRIMLYVGRFAPLKGIERLFEATALLRRRFADLQLLVVGGDGASAQSHQALADLADRLELQDIIRFMGRIEQAQLPPYYCAADVLVLPSHYESFGLVLLEALACGTPVATTRVGAAEAIVRESLNGTFIDGPGHTDVAAAIERIFGKSPLSRAAADQIRAAVDGYGWSCVAESMEAAYYRQLEIHDATHSVSAAAP
jgi:D-inositol-3-phosphate glycosyltransferase